MKYVTHYAFSLEKKNSPFLPEEGHRHSPESPCLTYCYRNSRQSYTMHGASFLNRARNSRCTVITDLDTSKRSTQKAFSCCDAILETGPAAPQ